MSVDGNWEWDDVNQTDLPNTRYYKQKGRETQIY